MNQSLIEFFGEGLLSWLETKCDWFMIDDTKAPGENKKITLGIYRSDQDSQN